MPRIVRQLDRGLAPAHRTWPFGLVAGLAFLAGCYGVPKSTPPELSPAPRTSGSLPLVEESLARAAAAQELPAPPPVAASLLAAMGPQPTTPELDLAVTTETPSSPVQTATTASSPAPPARPVAAALTAWLEGNPQEATAHLQSLAPKDQEVLRRLLPFLVEMDQRGLFLASASKEKAQAFLDTLHALEIEVLPFAPVNMGQLIFCTWVRGYGQYQARKNNHFRPGDFTWVYVELRNIHDQRLPDGRFGLKLTGQLEICRQDGQPIGKPITMIAENLSMTPRRDFFIRFDYTVPAHLPPGPYQMRLRITDQATSRTAESTASFVVLAGD